MSFILVNEVESTGGINCHPCSVSLPLVCCT
nr:MAG TPA: hypothetical protein [Caudoviricetes sp.]DAW55019.1 MAG TPA: hypothetical protein [Caudoviricetes sp.]